MDVLCWCPPLPPCFNPSCLWDWTGWLHSETLPLPPMNLVTMEQKWSMVKSPHIQATPLTHLGGPDTGGYTKSMQAKKGSVLANQICVSAHSWFTCNVNVVLLQFSWTHNFLMISMMHNGLVVKTWMFCFSQIRGYCSGHLTMSIISVWAINEQNMFLESR